jgi:hypothetical protein
MGMGKISPYPRLYEFGILIPTIIFWSNILDDFCNGL